MPNEIYQQAAESLRKNEGQWAAYESKGHCVVLAGPGSGKTKTLTVKLARMLAEDVNAPRGIACITYTRECAAELTRRLDGLGVGESSRVFIGTVHSFCFQQLVMPFGRLANVDLPNPIRVASGPEREKLFAAALSTAVGANENPKDWADRFYKFRRTVFTRHHADYQADDPNTAAVVDEYEKRLKQSNLTDFDQMITVGLRLVEEHAWVRKALRAKFPILVVDEYQDMLPALDRLVQILCFKEGLRLFAVGDPDQAIYGFQDASPEPLKLLAARDDVEDIPLALNYRCGKTIIAAAELALGEARNYGSENPNPGTIYIHKRTDGLEGQATLIVEKLIPEILARTPGIDLSDIAILYRDQYTGTTIAKAVKGAGFDFIRIDRGNPIPSSPLIDWIKDCAAWCADGWRTSKPRLSAITREWQSLNRLKRPDVESRELQISLIRFLQANRTPDATAFDWLIKFEQACLKSFLEAGAGELVDAENFKSLLDHFKPGAGFAAFTVKSFGGQGGAKGHLNLMTLHSAKGLEFTAVIIPDLEQEKFPGFRSIKAKQVGNDRSYREERRLFYVGVTRSKSEVHLLWSGWISVKGNIYHKPPSDFLKEVAKSIGHVLK